MSIVSYLMTLHVFLASAWETKPTMTYPSAHGHVLARSELAVFETVSSSGNSKVEVFLCSNVYTDFVELVMLAFHAQRNAINQSFRDIQSSSNCSTFYNWPPGGHHQLSGET